MPVGLGLLLFVFLIYLIINLTSDQIIHTESEARDEKFNNLNNQAIAAFNKKDYQSARTLFREARSYENDLFGSRCDLKIAECSVLLKDYKKAMEMYWSLGDNKSMFKCCDLLGNYDFAWDKLKQVNDESKTKELSSFFSSTIDKSIAWSLLNETEKFFLKRNYLLFVYRNNPDEYRKDYSLSLSEYEKQRYEKANKPKRFLMFEKPLREINVHSDQIRLASQNRELNNEEIIDVFKLKVLDLQAKREASRRYATRGNSYTYDTRYHYQLSDLHFLLFFDDLETIDLNWQRKDLSVPTRHKNCKILNWNWIHY